MSILTRLILTTTLALVVLIWGVVSITSSTMERSFVDLERQDAFENLRRAERAVLQLEQDVHAKTSDWAFWDDTYEFMADRNEEYVKSNLSADSLALLKIDLLLLVDGSHQVAEAMITSRLSPKPKLDAKEIIQKLDVKGRILPDGLSGLVSTSAGVMVLSARPVMPTNMKGAPRGWLIFGRLVGAAETRELETLTQLDVSLAQIKAGSLDWQRSLTIANSFVRGRDYLKDISGQPVLGVEVKLPETSMPRANGRSTSYLA